MASPFAALGQALGGDSELAYQQGLNLGARTEEALAQAAERVDKNRAKIALAEQLKAAGVPETLAEASAGGLRAGAGLGDVADLILSEQERGFRDDAAGVTGLDFATGNRRAMGFASGPVDRFQRIGNKAVDDRFDAEGPVGLGDALVGTDGGGDAAGIQMLRAFGLLDPTGRVAPENREQAFDVYRSTDRSVDLGGTPGVVTANPFSAQRRVATPAAATGEVAGNAAEIARQKEIGQQAGTAEAALGDTLADIDKLRSNITNFIRLPGFAATYGNVQGQPVVRGVLGLADQDIADAQAALKNLDAQTFGIAIQKMRGLGQLSNAEGEKVTSAFTRATNPLIGEAEAQLAWNEVLDGLDLAEARAKRKAAMRPSTTSSAPAAPAAPAQPVEARITNDAEYDALPPGTVYVGPDGVRRKKP